ncbi:hypothetical protein D770_11810 [Flammeovirgaceae bacterium 311]|nr:hypothetical protein D770_11810 [Flammeovirgaceae bacterium 311]
MQMNKLYRRLILILGLAGTVLAGNSCSETVYVTQQRQTFNDYKAMKHDKVVNKTRRPKVRSHQ